MHLLPAGGCMVVFCARLDAIALSTLRAAPAGKTVAFEGVEANNIDVQAAANI